MAATLEQGTVSSFSGPNDSVVDKSFVDLSHFVTSRASQSFSEREDALLSLYDQLDELRLEHAILERQLNSDQGMILNDICIFLCFLLNRSIDLTTTLSNDEAESQLKEAERECLEARSAYLLRNSVVENVISVDPLLKAIHAGTGGEPLER